MHVTAKHAIEREVSFPNAVGGAMQLAIEHHHLANGMFGLA